MKNILLVCYGGGHASMLVPVIKKLQKRRDCKVIVMALTTAAHVMKGEGIEYIGYKELSYLVSSDYLQFGLKMIQGAIGSSVVSKEESVAYHGINFIDMIERVGLEAATALYETKGRQSFYPIKFMKKVLNELDIGLIISTNSPRSERAAFDASRELGIKRLCLVDLFALQEVKWIGKPGFASKICVLNESVKNMFIDAGVLSEDIEITGNPAFDSLNLPSVIENGVEMKRARRWDDSKITLLYASQPEPLKHPFNERIGDPLLPRNIENLLRQFISTNERYRLVIRYHPSENVQFEPQDNVYLSPRGESLHSLLHAVDIVVVTASTVGLEANLIGKDVISIDNSIFTKDAPYSKMGISIGVPNVESVAETIQSLKFDLKASKPLDKRVSACSKIMKVIDGLL